MPESITELFLLARANMTHPMEELYNTLAEPDGIILAGSTNLLRDYAAARGVVMRSAQMPNSSSLLVHVPMALLPATIPYAAYQTAYQIQLAVGRMLHNMSLDDAFLESTLSLTAGSDEFTQHLLRIHMATKDHTRMHPQLGMLRSDYLLHEEDNSNPLSETASCKLVEVNTIAAGFGGLMSKIPPFHERLIDTLLSQVRIAYDKDQYRLLSACDCAQVLANGLGAAHTLYEGKYRSSSMPLAILMVVQPIDRNVADQKELELLLPKSGNPAETYPIVIRRDLNHLAQFARLNNENALLLDGYEISVVYYRDGYMPQHYTGEQHWKARLLMESSNAIKCPTVRLQLVGTKKVQQVFSHDPDVVEKYLPREMHNQIDAIRSTLVENYTLDEQAAVARALEQPDLFVLKPQREGGGNNFFGETLRQQLTNVKDTDERHAYILMQKIIAPKQLNYLIRPDLDGKTMALDGETINEYGFYSYILGNATNVVDEQLAKQCLVRTKQATADEGGVTAGYAFMNSPLLVCKP